MAPRLTLKETTFDDFIREVKDKLEGAAAKKGYNTTGVEGKNELYEFVQNIAEGDGHAIGEIVYKAVRYSRKHEKDDLIKIAAWAYLLWKFGK